MATRDGRTDCRFTTFVKMGTGVSRPRAVIEGDAPYAVKTCKHFNATTVERRGAIFSRSMSSPGCSWLPTQRQPEHGVGFI